MVLILNSVTPDDLATKRATAIILRLDILAACGLATQWGTGGRGGRGRVTHICVGHLTIIGSDNGLSPGRRQAIIWSNQCWNIINWTLGNKLQWNFNRNSNIFIQEIAFESVVCEKAAILSRPQWVKTEKLCWWCSGYARCQGNGKNYTDLLMISYRCLV